MKVPEVLAALLGVDQTQLKIHVDESKEVDLLITAVGQTFGVQFSKSTGAGPMAAAIKKLQERTKRLRRRVVPLLVVPYMGEIGKRLCESADIAWMDLSGNAHIVVSRLRIIVDGQPNRFLAAGRPANLFAPMSSRVARWLLIHQDVPVTQRELAKAIGLGEGFVSRIVRRLETEGYIVRTGSNDIGVEKSRLRGASLHVQDANLLLDAWRETYQFSRHTIHQGHIAARSGDELLRVVCETLSKKGIEYAATGLSAAWMYTRFATFRSATVYLPSEPAPALLERLGYREDPRGANLWLVVPNDVGVFQDAAKKDGIRCVHPVQVYVDLKGQTERAPEAAERIRTELLKWRRDG